MSEEQSVVRWGDIIRIHGVTQRSGQENKGLIMSKGFTDLNVYYQEYADFADVSFYRESLFQIMPKCSFDLHDQLLDEDLMADEKAALSESAKEEVALLKLTLALKAGQHVTYGSETIFRHIESGDYLSGVLKAADISEGAFKLELSGSLSSFLIFEIRSHRSYQKEGNKIYYDDCLQLYHVKSDCYTNFSDKGIPILFDQPYDVASFSAQDLGYEHFQNRLSIKKPLQKRIDVVNENRPKCLWKFILHCTYELSLRKDKIKSHEIVYFRHTRHGGLIASTLARQNYYLKEHTDIAQCGKCPESSECFWELVPKKVNEFGPEKCNLFWARNIVTGQILTFGGFQVEIQSKEEVEGGGFNSEGQVNLVCTQTGALLERGQMIMANEQTPPIVKRFEESVKKLQFQAVQELKEDSFTIVCVSDQTILDVNYVLSSHEVFIRFVQVLSTEAKAIRNNRDMSYHDMFSRLNEDLLITMISVLKLLKAKVYCTNFEDIDSSGNSPVRQIQRILVETGIAQLLIEILFTLFEPFLFIERTSHQISSNRSIRHKLTEIFECSYRLLETVVKGFEENRIYLSRWVDLFLLHCNHINKPYIQNCLVSILHNNPVSILATIDDHKILTLIKCFFEEAAQLLPLQNNLSTTSLANNPPNMSSASNPLNMPSTNPNKSLPTKYLPTKYLPTKYLRLFSTFIKCEDSILKANQLIILHQFFRSKQNRFGFRFQLQELQTDESHVELYRNRVVRVSFGEQEYLNIREFFHKHSDKFNYLISYLNLLADVCMGRNSDGIETAMEIIPLSAVSTLLFDPDLQYINREMAYANEQAQRRNESEIFPNVNLHEPFVRIGHHVYVNNRRFYPIKRIKKILKWHEYVAKEEDISRTKRVYQGEKEEEEKNNLKCLLLFIREFLQKCDLGINNLQILQTVLAFFKETIILGLWESIDQFCSIIPLLVKHIIKIQASTLFEAEDDKPDYASETCVDSNKKKLKMNRPHIALMIDCKIKAAEIFQFINQLEIDIRLRQLAHFFRGVYLAYENFEKYNYPVSELGALARPIYGDISKVNKLKGLRSRFYDARTSLSDAKTSKQVFNKTATWGGHKHQSNRTENEGSDEEKESETQAKCRDEVAKQQFNKPTTATLLGPAVKKVSEEQQVLLRDNIWNNKINDMLPMHAETELYLQKNSRDLFKYASHDELSPSSIVMSLFELSGYRNQSLLNSSLHMLRSMFQQRKQLIHHFQALLICGKGNLHCVYLTLKFMRNKFAMLQSDDILQYGSSPSKSFGYFLFKPYDHIEREEEKRSGIIQDLFFLARTLKDGVSLKNIQYLMHVDQKVFDRNSVYHFYSEREKNNHLFQELNMAEGIYVPLLDYVKRVGKNENLSELHRWLLLSVYQYLTLLCFNNMKAKHILMEHIQYILPHLTLCVGAHSLLYEICINNKLLVNSEQTVRIIVEACLQACAQLEKYELIHAMITTNLYENVNISTDYEKSRILCCLRGVLIFNDQGNKRNQELLMNRLQDNKYRHLIYRGETKFWRAREDFSLNPQETYIATHFQLLSTLVQSANLINIGKLENLHKYDDCLRRLEETNRWQLRRSLRSYLNRLYYVHKDKDVFLFEKFVDHQFRIINIELFDLIELHRSRMLTPELKIRNGIRFVYAQSEITLLMIQIFITLHEMFSKAEFVRFLKEALAKDEKKDDQKELQAELIRLLKNLGCVNLLYPHAKAIHSFIKEIKSQLTPIFETFNVRYLEKKAEPGAKEAGPEEANREESALVSVHNYDHSRSFFRNLAEMIRTLKHAQKHEQLKQEQNRRKSQMDVTETQLKLKYIEVIFSVPGENLRPAHAFKLKEPVEQHYQPHLQTASSTVFKILSKPDLEENEQNKELNYRLQLVKELLSDSPVFLKLCQDQFYKLVDIFTHLDFISSTYYAEQWAELREEPRPVFTRKEILSNCFTLIREHPQDISDSEKIFVIKLARCYVSEAVERDQSYKLGVDRWSADYYTDDQSGHPLQDPAGTRTELVRRQHEIEECGGSQFLVSILKEDLFSRCQLLNETLLLGIVYLFNGNTHCQNSLLQQLKEDRSNATLASLRQLILTLGNFIIEIRNLKECEKRKSTFNLKIVDSYDYYDTKQNILLKLFGHKDDKFQLQTEISYQLALCRIFRFLQLFCENNNAMAKSFICRQTNLPCNDSNQQEEDRGKTYCEGETVKTNYINFVSEACLLLRKLFKIMSSKIVSIPPSILDFINEVTQIPCLENQVSMVKSTFFEDISYMAGFFESKENIEQRKFNFVYEDTDDPILGLMEIYEKGVGLALSNFQGNDRLIYEEFLNKCQPKFLWIVIKQNLTKILRARAEQYGVNREVIETKLVAEEQEKDALQLQIYKQFMVEKAFQQALLAAFTPERIEELIRSEQAKTKIFEKEITNILSVIALLKKIDDYADACEREAVRDKENPNWEQAEKARKARQFRAQLCEYGRKDYDCVESFLSQFQCLVLSIEISSDNGQKVGVQNVYFPKHPVFSYLASDTCNAIMMEVNRSNRRDKLISLFGFYDELKDEIQWNYDMKYCTYRAFGRDVNVSITSELINSIRGVARKISFLIIILMCWLITVEHHLDDHTSTFTFFYHKERLFLEALCLAQLALTVIFFVLWLQIRLPLCLAKHARHKEEKAKESPHTQLYHVHEEESSNVQPMGFFRNILQKLGESLSGESLSGQSLSGKSLPEELLRVMAWIKRTWQTMHRLLERIADWRWAVQLRRRLRKQLQPAGKKAAQIVTSVLVLFRYESDFLSILLFVCASLYSNFAGVEWYTIHIFDYFVTIPLLTNVFKAIIKNIKDLMLLSAFAGCFILVFNVLSLGTYASVVYKEDLPQDACGEIVGCVLELYTSGAIGEDMDQLYPFRFVFDTVYVVFMELLFQNLVSGMMIDTFSGLKEADAERDEDKRSTCYICSLTKSEMEKQGTTFEKHKKKHLLWNYLFYKYCLDMKDPTDYTGLQYDIALKIEMENVDWFPDNGKRDLSGDNQLALGALRADVQNMFALSKGYIDKSGNAVWISSKALRALRPESNQ